MMTRAHAAAAAHACRAARMRAAARPCAFACQCAFAVALAALLGALALPPHAAAAEAQAPYETAPAPTEEELGALQVEVERTAAAYAEAQQQVASLDGQVAQARDDLAHVRVRIRATQAALDEQKQRSAAALRTLYVLHEGGYGLVDVVFGSQDVNDFVRGVDALGAIEERNVAEIRRYAQLKEHLQADQAAAEETQEQLAAAREQAQQAATQAADALAAAQAAREEAQERAKAAAEAAARAAQQQAATLVAAGTIDDAVDWSVDKQAFVDEWGPRIDAYLGSAPLGGQGAAFAAAAWDYGVDPRWSPAISNTESGKGYHVPDAGGHNAWGWTNGRGGYRTFASWEEAIYEHVAYLARVYGYTITPEAAQKYCPPTWDAWYAETLGQMQRI